MRSFIFTTALVAGVSALPYEGGSCWQQGAVPKLLANFKPLEQPADDEGNVLPVPKHDSTKEWRNYLKKLRKGERRVEPKNNRLKQGVTIGDDCYRLRLSGHGRFGELTLEAVCKDSTEARNEWDTSINLNRCLGNNDGHLGWIEDGNFDYSCWNCNVGLSPPAPGAMLRCDCASDDETTFYGWVELGGHLEHPMAIKPDGEGRLTCGNVVGTKEMPPDGKNFQRPLKVSRDVESGEDDLGHGGVDDYDDQRGRNRRQ